MNLIFDDEAIEKIFGSEAADAEKIERLKEYYFKNKVYERITANLPVRLIVGHKGIGKSALIRFAMHEDYANGVLPILVRPEDVVDVAKQNVDFIQRIQDWKAGLLSAIRKKTFDELSIRSPAQVQSSGSGFLQSLLEGVDGLLTEKGVTLDPFKKRVAEKFLEKKMIRIYIDDLDRGWGARKDEVNRISALLSAALDLCRDFEGLQFRVALRSDVYFLYRTSDESTDKTEGSVVWFSWTNHELLVMLVKRIETYFQRPVNDEDLVKMHQQELSVYLNAVITPRFEGSGKWENAPMHRILMTLVRRRPRDLVKLCSLAARKAHNRGASIISTEDFEQIFEEYSQGRAQDTYNEYRSELPDVERLILSMRPTVKERREGRGWIYSTDELIKKINSISEQGKFRNSAGLNLSALQVAQFLYKINFLIARKQQGQGVIERVYFEENRYLFPEFRDFGYQWEVHPAFRKHLQPEHTESLHRLIDLSVDT